MVKLIAFVIGSLVLYYVAAAEATPVIRGLGRIPNNANPGGFLDISTHRVSANGNAVVGADISLHDQIERQEGTFWTSDTGMLGLGFLPGGNRSIAWGVSGDGLTVVGQSNQTAVTWTLADGYSPLFPGTPGTSRALGTSDDGNTIVGEFNNEAFLWTEADGRTQLGSLPGGAFTSEARDISADGTVIVGSSTTANGDEAFGWTPDDGLFELGDLPGGEIRSFAYGVSANGNVIVGESKIAPVNASDGGRRAFRWTENDGMVPLGDLVEGSYDSVARDVSADGSVIVGEVSPEVGGRLGFVWTDEAGMRTLNDVLVDDFGVDLGGWDLANVRSVTPDGLTFAGVGFNPDGLAESFIVTVPEPATVVLLITGFVALSRRRRF